MRIGKVCLLAAVRGILARLTGTVCNNGPKKAILKVCQGGVVLSPSTDGGMEDGGLGDEP